MMNVFKNSENNDQKACPVNQGIACFVFQNKKSCIISDVKASSNYDKFVDILSNLPIYVVPIIE